MVFSRDAKVTISYRNNRGSHQLEMKLPSDGCRLYEKAQRPIVWRASAGRCILPASTPRCFFECGNITREQVVTAIEQANLQ